MSQQYQKQKQKWFNKGIKEEKEKWKQAVKKFFNKFHKLVEVHSSEYGDPVVMSGLKNDFCAIDEYWRLENELRDFGGLAE